MSRRAAVGWLAGLLFAAATEPVFAQAPVPTFAPPSASPLRPAFAQQPEKSKELPMPGKAKDPPTPGKAKDPPVPDLPKLPPLNTFPQPPKRPDDPKTPKGEALPQPRPVPGDRPEAPATELAYGPIPGPATPMEVEGPSFARPMPLPGSVEDEYTRELLARDGFRTYTWRDTAITAFPSTLLWDPGLAVQRDPRMKATFSNQPNFRGSESLDVSIGGTQALFRSDFIGRDLQLQSDIFGVVHTRLSPEDVTFADYRFGLPFTAKWGWWQGKFGYEHTSSHLGDRLLQAVPQQVRAWAKDEVVLGIGRLVEEQLRLYATYAYAFQFVVPGVEATTRTRGRFELGFEWFDRRSTGFAGTPYLAGSIEWQGSQGNVPNYTAQAGWMWRNATTRLSQFRVYLEHYWGQSPFGINSAAREQYTAFGIGFDY